MRQAAPITSKVALFPRRGFSFNTSICCIKPQFITLLTILTKLSTLAVTKDRGDRVYEISQGDNDNYVPSGGMGQAPPSTAILSICDISKPLQAWASVLLPLKKCGITILCFLIALASDAALSV
jgi:hypothetical protein